MIRNDIKLCGITPKHCFPECLPDCFNQLCETDILNIQKTDPDIQEVVGVNLGITIREFQVLCTPLGKKLLVHAVKQIDIIFKHCGIKYVSRFCIPFCNCILLDHRDEKVIGVHVIVEDIDIFQMNPRTVGISALLFIFPEYKKKNDEWHDASAIRCDIKLKSC